MQTIFDQQYDLILAKHGKDAADSANYGWSYGSDDDGSPLIATKVYVEGGAVLLSKQTKHQGISHDWVM